MKIEKNRVVGIHYTLTDNDGKVLDSSRGNQPLLYLHGNGNLIPGLENALEGKRKNDTLNVKVMPDMGYGEFDENMIFEVNRSQFDFSGEIKKGMQFQMHTDHGHQVVTVSKIEGDLVILDGNHPLAGQELNFEVEVTDVREASGDEISHGHVHQHGHHHH
jgi:FKBP-type peptidyl-prolyl cis-trans isomerase SlyD